MGKQTDVNVFLDELDSGILKDNLGHLISQVALGTMVNAIKNGKKGEIAIKLQFQRLNDDQIVITHTLGHKTPTGRGYSTETETEDTYMYVARGGACSLVPPKENVGGQTTVEGEIMESLEQEQDGKRPNTGNVRRLGSK